MRAYYCQRLCADCRLFVSPRYMLQVHKLVARFRVSAERMILGSGYMMEQLSSRCLPPAVCVFA